MVTPGRADAANSENPDDAVIERPKHPPLTLAQVLDQLNNIAKNWGTDLPVHLLVMHAEDEEGEWWGNLTTHVELDRFSDSQGLVVSLMCWPSAFSTPVRHPSGEWRPPHNGSRERPDPPSRDASHAPDGDRR